VVVAGQDAARCGRSRRSSLPKKVETGVPPGKGRLWKENKRLIGTTKVGAWLQSDWFGNGCG